MKVFKKYCNCYGDLGLRWHCTAELAQFEAFLEPGDGVFIFLFPVAIHSKVVAKNGKKVALEDM